MQLDKGGHKYLTLKSIAYNAARIAVTGAATWPFFLPNPRHTAKYVLKKVLKVAVSGRMDKEGHRMQVHSRRAFEGVFLVSYWGRVHLGSDLDLPFLEEFTLVVSVFGLAF
jgi:hypothetical protein